MPRRPPCCAAGAAVDPHERLARRRPPRRCAPRPGRRRTPGSAVGRLPGGGRVDGGRGSRTRRRPGCSATAAGLHPAPPAPSRPAAGVGPGGAVAGRLAEARGLFDRAADAAEAEGEPVLAAQAALGLGGVWVDEHRDPAERRAGAGPAAGRAGRARPPRRTRCCGSRLRTRLAAEAVYTGAPAEPVPRPRWPTTRRLGDRQALAEALSLTHHALLAPGPRPRPAAAGRRAGGGGVRGRATACWC